MELRTPETDKTIRNAAGSLTISVKKNGRTATVTRSLELNKQQLLLGWPILPVILMPISAIPKKP